MITNFENITFELTDKERLLLPVLLTGFRTKTKDNPIKAPDVVKKINEAHIVPYKFTESRLRKICNYIRVHGLLPLIATSKGYYVSYDIAEINSEITSLRQRANAIASSAQGLEKFLQKQTNPAPRKDRRYANAEIR